MLGQSMNSPLYRSADWLKKKYWDEEFSSTEMAGLAGVQKCTILRWMKRLGIPKRTSGETLTLKNGYARYKNKKWLWEHYVEKELSTYQIADQIGCGFQTVCRWLDELDIPKRDWTTHLYYENRESLWNDEFFDELTFDTAYVIGMIIADGSLRGIKAKQYNIGITQKNRDILDKISDAVHGGNIHKVNRSWSLHLNSKHAYGVLIEKYGLPPGQKKSYTVRIPHRIIEREDLLPHCIRGIFDGDGSVARGGTHFSFSSGSIALLNDIANVLTRIVSLPPIEPQWEFGGYIKKNGERSGAYHLSYNNVLDAIDFGRFIYGSDLDIYGSTLYLERKRKHFQTICDRWRGREWLCEQIDKGKTNEDIADELGVVKHRVAKVLNGIGVYDFPHKDPKWLRDAVEVQGRSNASIGREFSVRSDRVQYYCDKYGIEYVPIRKPMPKEIDDPEWLRKKYWEEGLSLKEMATLVGVALNTIINRMNTYSIPRRHAKWNLELGL